MEINNFIEELKKINILLNNKQLEQLEQFYKFLIEKNKVMNLTGITEKKDVYLKHFYDSLTLNKIIDLKTINTLCDLGSGAGFPGIVLKICFPDIQMVLVDSLTKRINFLNEVISKLKLKNITTSLSRIEEYSINNKEKFDLVTARAVSQTNILLELGCQLPKVGGYFITMKANDDVINLNMLNQLSYIENKKIVFTLPIENSIRTLTIYKKINHVLKIFPRKFKEIKNNPL